MSALIVMHLREHPLMTYRGVSNWPPVWTTTRVENSPRPAGEVGVLEEALMNDLFDNKIFLVMLHDGNRYLGSLIFDDISFCHQVFALLKLNRGKRIKDIGDLDLSQTL
jgi:hypothetical protein